MEKIIIKKEDKILIIAPHPDDECIGVGGILCAYPSQCDIVVMTDGSLGNKKKSKSEECTIRKIQFEREMEFVQPHTYYWLGYPDGQLINIQNCMGNINFSKYSIVFIPWGDDNHPDHTAAFFYAIEEIKKRNLRDIAIYMYEVHLPFKNVTHYLDISNSIKRKQRLICYHKDQMKEFDYSKSVKTLASYRACLDKAYNKYYECYIQVDAFSPMNYDIVQREKMIVKYQMFFGVLLAWIKDKNRCRSLADKLIEMGHHQITIYGFSDLGIVLYQELKDSEITVCEILDKRRINNIEKIFYPEDGNRQTDVVVVTAIADYNDIKEYLTDLGYKNILSLQQLVDEKI